MKRKQLLDMGLTDEQVDSIMALHGQSTTQLQQDLATATASLATAEATITEANAKIDEFKGMNIDQIKQESADWKTKYDQSIVDKETEVKSLKYDQKLADALKEAKVKDPNDVIPHLKKDTVVLGEDGLFVGLDEQLKPLKEKKPYLFEETKVIPTITTQMGQQSVLTDAFTQSARKAAQLPEE